MLHRKGFTLVEILFVLIIIATIVAFAVPSYNRTKQRARYEAAVGVLVNVGNAVQSINQDLRNIGSAVRLPINGDFTHVVDSEVHMGVDETFSHFMENCDDNADCVLGAMYQKYLQEEIPADTGYQFFAVDGNSSACAGQCRGIACMCSQFAAGNSMAPACFYGANMLANGTIERIKLPSCERN